MKITWRSYWIISWLAGLFSCANNTGFNSGKYEYEGRVTAFLRDQAISTEKVNVFFFMQSDCPCTKQFLNDLESAGTISENAYLFSDNEAVRGIDAIRHFGFKKITVYNRSRFEREGVGFATPKIFCIKNGEITAWKEY